MSEDIVRYLPQALDRQDADVHLDKARAKKLLTSYVRTLMIAGPGTWTGGDKARTELIIDCITYPLEQRIAALEQRLAALEADHA